MGQGARGDQGWVEVGIDHDTAAFAVAAIRAWWYGDGAPTYPTAKRLLITADAGGSNSYRGRLWKKELAILAAETGLAIPWIKVSCNPVSKGDRKLLILPYESPPARTE